MHRLDALFGGPRHQLHDWVDFPPVPFALHFHVVAQQGADGADTRHALGAEAANVFTLQQNQLDEFQPRISRLAIKARLPFRLIEVAEFFARWQLKRLVS